MKLTKFQQECGASEEDFLLYLESRVPQYQGKGRKYIEEELGKATVKTWEADYVKEKVVDKMKAVEQNSEGFPYDWAIISYDGHFNQWSFKTFNGNIYQAYVVEKNEDYTDVAIVNENNSPTFEEEIKQLYNTENEKDEPKAMCMWMEVKAES